MTQISHYKKIAQNRPSYSANQRPRVFPIVRAFLTILTVASVVGCANQQSPDTVKPTLTTTATPPAPIAPITPITPIAPIAPPAPAPPPVAVLSGMTITPGAGAPGQGFAVEATLNSPAPFGGATVALTMDRVVQNPIHILAGRYSGSVSYTAGAGTSPISFDCSYGGVTYSAVRRTVLSSPNEAQKLSLNADITACLAAIPNARLLDEQNKQWNEDQVTKNLQSAADEQEKINELRREGYTDEADRKQQALNLAGLVVVGIGLGTKWQRPTDNESKLNRQITADRNALALLN